MKLHANGADLPIVNGYTHGHYRVIIREMEDGRYRFDVYRDTVFVDGDTGIATVSEAREAASYSIPFEGLQNYATPATLDTIPARLPGF